MESLCRVRISSRPETLYEVATTDLLLLLTRRTSVSQREHPHRTTFRHLRKLARADSVEPALHPARVDAPPGLHRDVLTSVEGERRRLADDAGGGGVLPYDLSSPCVERPEHAARGSPPKNHPPTAR